MGKRKARDEKARRAAKKDRTPGEGVTYRCDDGPPSIRQQIMTDVMADVLRKVPFDLNHLIVKGEKRPSTE